jgi:hypothetical protein
VVYFLGTNGKLATFDPSEQGQDGEVHVSKPVLIGTGGLSGIFVNYRGLYHPDDEEANKFTIERDAICSDLRVGDLVRAKSSRDTDVSKTEFIPSSAEDFESSHVVGMVTLATPDYFEVQTNGLITVPIPEDLEEKGLQKILLNPGTQYYLDTLEEDDANGKFAIQDRLNMYELANQTKDDLETLGFAIGTPFRNSLPHDPATPLVPTDDGYKIYSRPVFIAISNNRLLLTNHRTLPNPNLECEDCYDHAEMEKSIYWPQFHANTETQLSDANTFLGNVWSSANIGHWVVLYKDVGANEKLRLRKYGDGWKKPSTIYGGE